MAVFNQRGPWRGARGPPPGPGLHRLAIPRPTVSEAALPCPPSPLFKTAGRPVPARPPGRPAAMSSVRSVRPRPLGVDERIPVYWAGSDAPPEIRAVDGGSLYRYVVAATPKAGQKRQRGDKFHAPREVRQARRSAGAWGGSFVGPVHSWPLCR